ncbi:MAG TPA: serine/threonine-protein kinase [Pyrinomonadaceae bacterium]|nr:serine/threonine-protein kinase [Pyrinomonadaceae bacterium]
MLAPETVLQSRYRIVRLLGQGGMGAVYEAIDERLETTVALKETLFADERLRKQFEHEAKLLAGMHHPALPRVSDHFGEGDGQFLVMQFIPGYDLSQMMARKQAPFPLDQVLTWGDQLLDALDYLHTQDPQIIHRDIKPQNLKLTGRGQIILLDFGLAKGQSGGVSVVTTSASIYGYTPNYAPLEQIQGMGTDARSDIYALSATLYHLMTGVKPPDALTRAASLVNGQPDPLMPANEVLASIGPEVANVLARGMRQSRDQRYPTAAAMRDALKGTAEVVTLPGKSEAPTVLHAPSGATLTERAQVDSTPTMLKTGETTVVRSQTTVARRRVAPWALGAAALVLIGVLFGGFYAYQHRNSTEVATPINSGDQHNVNTAPVEPSPVAERVNSEPASGSLKEEKQPVGNVSPIVNEPAKKNEKSAKKNKAEKNPTGHDEEPDTNVGEHSPTREIPVTPEAPEVFIPNTQQRTLRNGNQVTILPDGRRIVTTKDGTVRVIPPARFLRRRRVN